MKAALASIRDTPCLPSFCSSGSLSFLSRALAWSQVYAHGLKLLLIRLPYFVYIQYQFTHQRAAERKEPKKKSRASHCPTVAHLRRHLLDLRFLGKTFFLCEGSRHMDDLAMLLRCVLWCHMHFSVLAKLT